MGKLTRKTPKKKKDDFDNELDKILQEEVSNEVEQMNRTPKVPKPPKKSKIKSTQLKGLAWCVKQAFSAYNGKRKDGTPKTNWERPSASGEMILFAEEFLRINLNDKEYEKIFKNKKGWI